MSHSRDLGWLFFVFWGADKSLVINFPYTIVGLEPIVIDLILLCHFRILSFG
jgi:hypothetical protein